MAVRGSIAIRASAALTASYVAGTAIDTKGLDEVVLLIAYTMGKSETANSIQLTTQWSDDGGTTYYHSAPMLPLEESQTSGAVVVDKTVISYAADSAAETYDYIAVPIKVLGDKLKVSVKETGKSSNFGTCAIRASLVSYRK
jgi:hypothetical protein